MTDKIVLQSDKKVGGWLIALIVWLGLWVPAGTQGDVEQCDKLFGYLHGHDFVHDCVTYLMWSAAIAGAYCAFLIGLKKKGAVLVTKLGVAFISSCQLLMDVLVIAIIRPEISTHVVVYCSKPLLWFALWYSYLSRSKRVKETYVS